MSYELYKVMHLTGLFMVFSALGAYFIGSMAPRREGEKRFIGKKWAGIVHGIGLAVAIVSGFGLLARLGVVNGLPGWVYGKLLIWLFLGGVIALAVRKPQWSKTLWILTLLAGCAGAYLAGYKPF
jgi:hypothetical protein